MTEDSPGRNERLVDPFDGLPSMIKAYMRISTDAHARAIGLSPPEAMGKVKVYHNIMPRSIAGFAGRYWQGSASQATPVRRADSWVGNFLSHHPVTWTYCARGILAGSPRRQHACMQEGFFSAGGKEAEEAAHSARCGIEKQPRFFVLF